MAAPTKLVLKELADLAPLHLAEDWDNVGLIVDPGQRVELAHAFLTVDLTEGVLAEAFEKGADLIVAYHPPIFSGLKRLRHGEVHERVVVRAIRRGVTIYSPHTALDAAEGGMAEWLAACLGPGQMTPIAPRAEEPRLGAGRRVEFAEEISLASALPKIKEHLGLSHVRVSSPREDHMIKTMAVCPGAGGSLFQGLDQVDLLLTGEMRHHDVLARCAEGTAVVLTDHTNTERAYLPIFAERLRAACPGLTVSVSKEDADPLRVA